MKKYYKLSHKPIKRRTLPRPTTGFISLRNLTYRIITGYLRARNLQPTPQLAEYIRDFHQSTPSTLPSTLVFLLPRSLRAEQLPQLPDVEILTHPQLAVRISFDRFRQHLPPEFFQLSQTQQRQQLPRLAYRLAGQILQSLYEGILPSEN